MGKEAYTVKRVFLGKISAEQTIRNVIQKQLKQSMRRQESANEEK